MDQLIHEIQTSLDVNIQLRPGCAVAEINLRPNEILTTEGGCMIAMSPNLEMNTSTHTKKSGGIIKGIKRLVSGESFFINHYNGALNGGKLWLSASLPGDMIVHKIKGDSIIIQGGSYVASTQNIDIDLSWQGFKNLLSGESLFWIKATGTGELILNSFGAIYPIEIDGEYIVDTGHIVAFEESLNFSLSKAGKSWMSSFLGGEGLVCRFKGRGTVWVQSHNTVSFGRILGPKLKPR